MPESEEFPAPDIPTFLEFLERAVREFGCAYAELTAELIGPNGITHERYLQRMADDGKVRRVILPGCASRFSCLAGSLAIVTPLEFGATYHLFDW